jgi:hypothetical protein
MRNVTVTRADLADVRPGWPEEFGGGPRCQFCREPHPAWVYEGAEVEVLLGEPFLGFEGEPLPVEASEITGSADWHACGTCRDLIEAADFAAWRGLLGRYGDPDVPMPVQSAWASSGATTGRPSLPRSRTGHRAAGAASPTR